MKASEAMSELSTRGRASDRSEEPGARKKSKSRERGDTTVDELYEEMTNDTFKRMMEDGADARTIYYGQPQQVQTALQNRFLEDRMDFQKQRTQFELVQKEHAKLETVFGPILFGPAPTVPTVAPTVPTVAPTAPGLADTTAIAGLTSSFGYFGFKA